MRKELIVLTPDDGADGFGMAGVVQRVVEPAAIETTLRELAAQESTGVVVIDERLLVGLDEGRRQLLERTWPGLFVILPAPLARRPGGPDYLRRLLQRVLGYQVRLQR